jgi:hypothetical protein
MWTFTFLLRSGIVYEDKTVIEDTFISTTLVNSSKLTLAGKDVGNTLSEYQTRIYVLDSYLKTADAAHYYKYYFGYFMEDGGYARDNVSPYYNLYYPYGLATHKIRNNWYAFVSGYSSDTITVINASAVEHSSQGEQLPLISQWRYATDPSVGSNLDGPWGMTTAEIEGTPYRFICTAGSDGLMIANASNPETLQYVTYIDDSYAAYDKLGNTREVVVHTIHGKWYAFVTSYSAQTTSYGGNGMQVIDVSDPYNPAAVSSAVDGTDGFTCLNNPRGIDAMDIDGVPYVFVAAYSDDCIQIIDVSNPYDPVAAFAYTDMYGSYSYLNGAMAVKGFEANNRYYVMANAHYDVTVTIIDVTSPYACTEASSMSLYNSKSSNGYNYYGIGDDTNTHAKMDVYKSQDVFGRWNTFAAIVGHYSYGSLQIADISEPNNPYPVGWIQGSTSTSSDYYMMYYYTTDVKVIEIESGGNPRHYALVLSYYSAYDTTSYPNGIQVVKLDPYKTW